jgi:hypothetical protein
MVDVALRFDVENKRFGLQDGTAIAVSRRHGLRNEADFVFGSHRPDTVSAVLAVILPLCRVR